MICLIAALLLLLMLSACTAVAPPHALGDYSREQLLSGVMRIESTIFARKILFITINSPRKVMPKAIISLLSGV